MGFSEDKISNPRHQSHTLASFMISPVSSSVTVSSAKEPWMSKRLNFWVLLKAAKLLSSVGCDREVTVQRTDHTSTSHPYSCVLHTRIANSFFVTSWKNLFSRSHISTDFSFDLKLLCSFWVKCVPRVLVRTVAALVDAAHSASAPASYV